MVLRRAFLAASSTGLVLGLGASGGPMTPGVGQISLRLGHPIVRQVDGGASYFSKFAHSLPATANFFPIAIWSEGVADESVVATDKAFGINTFLEIPDGSKPEIASRLGVAVIPSVDYPGGSGFLLGDEVDMWGGVGASAWSGAYPGDGDICIPSSSKCGYTIMQSLKSAAPSGKPTFANYGKGVLFWDSDTEAAAFVSTGDVVSADAYWFTDPEICSADQGGSILANTRPLQDPSECRRAVNYGWTVDRVRSLVEPVGSKPVWSFVELGHPFPDGSTITSAQIRAAVWSSIIHGARGIVYFNNSFSGSCPTSSVLRQGCDSSVPQTVTSLDRQISELAPVLNSPFVDSAVQTRARVDVAVKVLDGDLYLFAQSTQPAPQTATFHVPCWTGGVVRVLDEDRQIPSFRNAFVDTFRGEGDVHVYRLSRNVCGL